MARVAIDLLGGDGAPEVVADAVAQLIADGSDIDLALVGPVDIATALLAARGVDAGRVALIAADDVVSMADHPLPAVREDVGNDDPRLTATVAARLVRDGHADAWVSVGHTGAAVMASVLTIGRIPGMSRAALAVVLPGVHGPVVLLDVGASLEATPDVLLQFATAGWAYALSLGVDDPVVGLLTIGAEPGKGDPLRQETHQLLAEHLPRHGIEFAGNVEGHDVVSGARAQVVVTDGFTGNVLLKGVEGTVAWVRDRIGSVVSDREATDRAIDALSAGDFAGGMLLGIPGVCVVGHGAGTAAEIQGCVRLAARAVDHGIVRLMQEAFAEIGSGSS